jgi:hypothetical protein
MALVDETTVLTDLKAQDVPDAEFLARVASDLNLDDADIQDDSGNCDAAKIRHLASVLLRWKGPEGDGDLATE